MTKLTTKEVEEMRKSYKDRCMNPYALGCGTCERSEHCPIATRARFAKLDTLAKTKHKGTKIISV